MRFPSFAGLVLLAAATSVQAISTISVLGNKFFNEDGSQFFIKGVAYQLTPDDPLLDKDQCSRDASLMEELGANSIRVYHVDPSQDHTDCMDILANAGIYLLVDLDTFDTAILAVRPGPSPQTLAEPYADTACPYRIAHGGTTPSTFGSPRLWMSFKNTTTPSP